MPSPDVIILSHHKCATNWQRMICRQLARRGLFTLEVTGGKMKPVPEAKNRTPHGHVLLNVNATPKFVKGIEPGAQPIVHFVRDPRDAFVSNYWSWARSHQLTNERLKAFRERAQGMNVEDGMVELVKLFPMGNQLRQWDEALWSAITPVRYEDMLSDFDGTLPRMFPIEGMTIPPEIIDQTREATSFKKIAGRNPGEEDVETHYRKGVAGDWENYFTDKVSKAFFDRHGWLGERLGYW